MKKYLCLLFLFFSFDLFAQSYSIPEAKRPKEIDIEKAKEIVKVFLNTDFEGERHQKRVDLIKKLEDN